MITPDELIDAGTHAAMVAWGEYDAPAWQPLKEVIEAVLGVVLPMYDQRIVDFIEDFRRGLPIETESYHGTIRSRDDMSWVLAQIRDLIIVRGYND